MISKHDPTLFALAIQWASIPPIVILERKMQKKDQVQKFKVCAVCESLYISPLSYKRMFCFHRASEMG